MSYNLMHIHKIFRIYNSIFNRQRGLLFLEQLRQKWTELSKKPNFKRNAIIACCAVATLLLALCISIIIRSNIQSKYANAIYQTQEETYQNLIEMTQLFARIDDPDVDVRNKLIPALKAKYTAARSLNEALISGYGKENAVLSDELVAAFDAAFDSYALAYRQGTPTGLARADMRKCIEDIQKMIDARYVPEVKEEDKVVIIDDSTALLN